VIVFSRYGCDGGGVAVRLNVVSDLPERERQAAPAP